MTRLHIWHNSESYLFHIIDQQDVTSLGQPWGLKTQDEERQGEGIADRPERKRHLV